MLTRKTVRGSIVGTRQDLVESLALAATGKIRVHYRCERLENINQVLAAMRAGAIEGRVVLDLSLPRLAAAVEEDKAVVNYR